MFKIYEIIFSIKIVKIKQSKKWHKNVTLYKIIKNNKDLAYFYFDLFPRKNKYSHAACFTLKSGCKSSIGKIQLPISAIVCNFSEKNKNIPSCLSISEVETLFHEFGHCIHNSFGQTKYIIFSGTSVERDFVEMPSQIIENWIYNKEILERISKNYKNNKKLTNEMIKKIINVRFLFESVFIKRQIILSKIDNIIHSNTDIIRETNYKKDLIRKVYHFISKEIYNEKIKTNKYTNMTNSFGHLVGGYDGMYYGYLWSRVIADDIYITKFQKNIFNKMIGEEYIKKIISKGGSEKADKMIKDFLGRKYKFNNFIKLLN